MRHIIIILALITSTNLSAQVDKVYNIVSEPARLMICEAQPMSNADKKKCSEQSLLKYITQKITYPEAAIADSIEGSVVVRFVVKKNGLVGDAKLLKDIGGGCGEAAMAVIDSIRADSVLWRPGVLDSAFVDSYTTIPVRFRIPRVYDYTVADGDTIFTTIDTYAEYEGGIMAFNMYMQQNLGYPRSGMDSCRIGDFSTELLIDRSGKAKLMDMADYNQLGIDFEFQAIRMINAMPANFTPAIRKGVNVPSLYTARILFQPPGAQCAEVITSYDQAVDIADKGDVLFSEGKYEEAIAQYTAAIDLVPTNVEHIFKRGMTYFEMQKYTEGCPDILEAKKHLVYTSVDALLPLFCRDVEEKK